MLSIKNADISDIPLIRRLTIQVWPQTYTPIVGRVQVAYMLGQFYTPEALEEQMRSGHQFILCYNDEIAAAFASWSQIAPGIFKLHKIYIITSQQGKGVGRFMLSHIVAEVKAMQATELRLNVNIHNSPAMVFYKKSGFKYLKDEDIDIGDGYFMNDHVLTLDLTT